MHINMHVNMQIAFPPVSNSGTCVAHCAAQPVVSWPSSHPGPGEGSAKRPGGDERPINMTLWLILTFNGLT